jgi:hypothetical protein
MTALSVGGTVETVLHGGGGVPKCSDVIPPTEFRFQAEVCTCPDLKAVSFESATRKVLVQKCPYIPLHESPGMWSDSGPGTGRCRRKERASGFS